MKNRFLLVNSILASTSVLMLMLMLMNLNILNANASEKYDFNISRVVYNATTGIVTIHDSSFSNPFASGISTDGTLSRIKVGGLTLSGRIPSTTVVASLSIVLNTSSRDDLNKQIGFDRNGTATNGIIFEDSAICKKQSAGINVVVTLGCYNSGFANVTVEGYYGPTVINSYTANQTRFDSSGGLLIITVRGDYLFTVGSNVIINDGTRDHWAVPGAMNSIIGTFSFNLPANTTEKDIVYTYIAYSRNWTHLGSTGFVPTNHKLTVTVLGERNSNQNENQSPSASTNKNNSNSSSANNNNNSSNTNNHSDSDIANPDNSNKNHEEIAEGEKVIANDLGPENNNQNSNKDRITIGILFFLIISGIAIYSYIKSTALRRSRNKAKQK